MKTNRPILAQITLPDTLRAAWQRIKAKRAKGGLDRVTVEHFAADLEANLDELRLELLEERYVPEPVQQIAVPKSSDPREKRTLGLACVRDKVAQEAVRSALEPRLERLFLDCSYGYRPGKGPQRAIGRVTHHLTNLKHRWIVTADIDDFFGSLNHDLLLDRVRAIVPDEAVVRLIELWLKMGAIDGKGCWHDVYSGVCQGAVISPLLANLYLHPFDQAMVEKKRGLARYADDFVITCVEQADAEGALLEASEFLERQLGLRLNPDPRPITSLEDGFTFLGVFFQDTRRLLARDKEEKIGQKIRRLADQNGDDFARALRELNEATAGWRRYYGAVLDQTELAKIDDPLRDGLATLVARALRRGTFRTVGDAEAALHGVEMVIPRITQDRRAWIAEVIRLGAARAKEKADAASPGSRHRKGRRLAAGDTLSLPAMKRSGVPAQRVASAVRDRKRRHLRQAARISELVLNTPGCFLGKTSERVVVRQERRNICEIPSFRLTGITVASRGVALSADIIDHCAEKDIPLLFLSPQGKLVATLSAPESSNGATGLLQLQALQAGGLAIEIAGRMVLGKISNQANLMKYVAKYRKEVDSDFSQTLAGYLAATSQLLRELREVRYAGDLEHTRGQLFSIEGRAAQPYWALVGHLLKPRVDFPGRERQGARDLVNSLLNYGYAVLNGRVYLAIIRAGLMPQISFLHALHRNKPTPVYDLMEEFRPQIVDRTVLTLFARREKVEVDGEGLLTPDTRKRFITRLEERLAALVRFRGQELKLEEIIGHQARALAAHLRGEATYRPFIAKW